MNTSKIVGRDGERGTISLLSAIGFGLLLAFCALVVDLGYARMTQSQLQSAADAASVAAVRSLVASDGTVDAASARQAASLYASKHAAGGDPIVLDDNPTNAADGDVVIGAYDETGEFVPATDPGADSVQVTIRRTKENGRPVELFFAKVFGRDDVDLGAASTASLMPVQTTPAVPLALAAPGFGPVDPAQPSKGGPSTPSNGNYFQVGEPVAMHLENADEDSRSGCSIDEDDDSEADSDGDSEGDSEGDSDSGSDSDSDGGSNGTGATPGGGLFGFVSHFSASISSHDHGDSDHADSDHSDSDADSEEDSDSESRPSQSGCEASSVHLVLDLERSGRIVDAGDVLKGNSDPEPVSIDDEFYVTSEGTGGGDFGRILKDRIRRYDDDDEHRTVVVPVVDTDRHSRNSGGRLVGKVRVVDFVAVHLDGIQRETIPDPDRPGKTIVIEKVMATVVRKVVGASATRGHHGVGGGSVVTVRLAS